MFPLDNLWGWRFNNLEASWSCVDRKAAVRCIFHIYGFSVECKCSLGNRGSRSKSCYSTIGLLHRAISGREFTCGTVVILLNRGLGVEAKHGGVSILELHVHARLRAGRHSSRHLKRISYCLLVLLVAAFKE
jgi:hypothetical protein